ncbi:hypothetical protein [Grimontia marina]|uniref:hypothetical protein n=1 Tax=Grimontia marina TaxID=646534 RepID=UPI0012FB1D58|nr:hypothetical protein [Grimontia marina]
MESHKALLRQDDIEPGGDGALRRKRSTAPFVMNPEMRELVRSAINLSPHAHKYITGALCWSIDENPILAENPRLALELKERFEAYMFAGINLEDQLIYWVQHTDKGRLEYNYVIPQICLSTGYHWNPIPPGKEYEINLIQDHFNLEFGLDSPDDRRYITEGRKRSFVPQKSKFFLPVPPFEGKSGARSKAIDYLYARIQSFDITCFEDVYRTLASNHFTKSTGLRLVREQRWSLGSSRHGAYVTLLSTDNKPIRLKGFAFSRRFTPGTLFNSRVQDARYDKETTKRVLREMQWEIRNMLMQRAYNQRQRCYPKEINDKPTFRYCRSMPEEYVSPKEISSLLNGMSATIDTHIVIPKFTNNMTQAEFEQIYHALLEVLLILDRRAVEKGTKSYLAHLELLYSLMKQESDLGQHPIDSTYSKTVFSNRQAHPFDRGLTDAAANGSRASQPSSQRHTVGEGENTDHNDDTIRHDRDRVMPYRQGVERLIDSIDRSANPITQPHKKTRDKGPKGPGG